MQIKEATPDEFIQSLKLRFTLLREPLSQPLGSELLPDDATALHIVSVIDSQVIGTCRMHPIRLKSPVDQLNAMPIESNNAMQVRCLCVDPLHQHKGIGRKLMEFSEFLAREKRMLRIEVEARQESVVFYEKIGYVVQHKSHVLCGIQHYRMGKDL